MEKNPPRTAAQVFDDHLRHRKQGSFETDLARNYDEHVVMLCAEGVFRGHDGVRELRRRLDSELPDARFVVIARVVDGDVAFLQWGARSEGAEVQDGADSFVIRDGRIVAQTVHYTVKPSRES